MNPVHFDNWTEAQKAALRNAKSFSDLFHVAMSVVKRMPPGVHMISGPISTGGVGTREGNMKVFSGVIEILTIEQGLNVFSQAPFELMIKELLEEWMIANPKEKYCTPILTDFYKPLFESRLVTVMHFINGWESSHGARFEHAECVRLGIKIDYLGVEYSVKALARAA